MIPTATSAAGGEGAARSIWKSISPLALASLACAALLYSAEPAAAAKKNICMSKYRACQTRCMYANDFANCHARTCDRQYKNCAG